MKTAIAIILLIVFFLLIAQTKITFKPFSFELKKPYEAVGWFLIVIGIALIGLQKSKDGYANGYNDGFESMAKSTSRIVGKEKTIEILDSALSEIDKSTIKE